MLVPPSNQTSRLPLLDAGASAEVAEALAKTPVRGDDHFNVFKMLAHNPRIMKRMNVLGGAFAAHGGLPLRVREIVILRVGSRSRCAYELGQHVPVGKAAGLTDEEISSITTGGSLSDPAESLLLAMADELIDTADVTDRTWAGLREHWSDSDLVELVTLAGFYRLLAGFLNTFRVPLEG